MRWHKQWFVVVAVAVAVAAVVVVVIDVQELSRCWHHTHNTEYSGTIPRTLTSPALLLSQSGSLPPQKEETAQRSSAKLF